MMVYQRGGWWYVRFTHRGKLYNLNMMTRGDSDKPKAEAYEAKLRGWLRSRDAGPVAAAVPRQEPPYLPGN